MPRAHNPCPSASYEYFGCRTDSGLSHYAGMTGDDWVLVAAPTCVDALAG